MQCRQDSEEIAEGHAYQRAVSRTLTEAHAAAHNDPQLLCRALRGAFPTLIAGRLKEFTRSSLSKAESFQEECLRSDLGWPEPHPADFDWRFDPATAKTLAELASAHGRVLCLGTPTVYEAIARLGGKAHLIDCNPFITSNLTTNEYCSFHIADLHHDFEIPGEFDAAVLDPPWYPDFYNEWLGRAVSILRRRHPTSLYITLFRELTRPAADNERAELLSELSSLGATSVLEMDAVYQTPPFEAELLALSDLPMLPTWRAADVVKVDVQNSAQSRFVTSACAFADRRTNPAAARFVFKNQIVLVECPIGDCGPISYSAPKSNSAGFMLGSVSRRDKARQTVNVWTSRNRGAAATGTHRIVELLNGISSKALRPEASPKTIDERDRALFGELLRDLELMR